MNLILCSPAAESISCANCTTRLTPSVIIARVIPYRLKSIDIDVIKLSYEFEILHTLSQVFVSLYPSFFHYLTRSWESRIKNMKMG